MDLVQKMDFIRHLDLGGMWLDVDLTSDTKKACVLKRLDYFLKHANHPKLKSQHNLEGLVWSFNEHENIHSGMNKIFTWAPKTMRQMATVTIWINVQGDIWA